MIDRQFKSRALLPIAIVFTASAAFVMIKTGRDTLFFRDEGIWQLPRAYIGIAILNVPVSLFHLKLIHWVGGRKARIGVLLFAAFAFLALALLTDATSPLLTGTLFVSVPIIFAAVFAGAWLLAADVLEGADQPSLGWAYSRLGAASMLGGIAGGCLSRGLAEVVPATGLVAVGGCLLLVALAKTAFAHRLHPRGASPATVDESPDDRPGVLALLRNPYVATLAMISGVAALASVLIDFQFYAAVTVSKNITPTFFANFYIVLNTASLLIQLGVAPRLQRRMGIGGALLVFPALLFSGVGAATFAVVASARIGVKAAEAGLKSALHRGLWEQAFLPIQRSTRAAAKAVVDGLLLRVAEGVGGLVLLSWLLLVPHPLAPLSLKIMSVATLVLILGWIAATRRLRTLGCSIDGPSEMGIRLPDS